MSQNINVKELFSNAQDEGLVSQQTVNSIFSIPDIGQQVQNAIGISLDDFKTSSEVVLVSLLIDDSGSIKYRNNEAIICEGHNNLIQAMKDSKQAGNMLLHTRYLNGKVLYPYCFIDAVPKMDTSNYQALGGTPLYKESVIFLTTILSKTLDYSNGGVAVRTINLILTDGHDEHSYKITARDVQNITIDMLRSENHIISGMGIDDGETDFKKVFTEMGVRPEWILTPKNTPSEIRKQLNLFSQSAVRASQSVKSFSQTISGGFTN